jgi:ADP-ribose pyrophosphatase YjhB (NUDIX family)
VERRRRIGAYGVCLDARGHVLLVQAQPNVSVIGGWWVLPGGGVEHGEHPERALVREIAEETGLLVQVVRLRDVVTDIDQISDPPGFRHHDRLIFEVRAIGGVLKPEDGGSSCAVAWFAPADLPGMELSEHTTRGLDLPPRPALVSRRDQIRQLLAEVPAPPPTPVSGARQRFAAYGLVTNPAGEVLLALISDRYPGAGHWHLPGGGTDFGESAADGLLRELVEETDQRGVIVGLIGASHRHNRRAAWTKSETIDLHGVRVVFRVTVTEPTPPKVNEEAGSTTDAGWFPPERALRLPLTEIAREHVGLLVSGSVTGA